MQLHEEYCVTVTAVNTLQLSCKWHDEITNVEVVPPKNGVGREWDVD